jgi:cell fate regulator YaaT (PSP1 superfamily)
MKEQSTDAQSEYHCENDSMTESAAEAISLDDKDVYKVKIVHSSATEFCVCPAQMSVKRGDYVIVPTRYGKDLGRVLGKISNLMEIGNNDVLEMERPVNADEVKQSEKDQEDKKAFDICRQKIEEHGLDMKLVSAHHLFGEPKILFFFTAETRVDFRGLVKNLVSVFRTRIELRQIGVRDESRVLGGIGVCGRGYCCHALTDKLDPVSIKMAKKQNLSLNSLKISGPCGRLLCCLSYEYPYYKEVKDKLPPEGARVQMNGERCKVLEINILSKRVKLSSEDGRFLELPFDRLYFDEQEKRWFAR